MKEVEIVVTESGIGSKVIIDGEEIKNLKGFDLHVSAGEATTLSLHQGVHGELTGTIDSAAIHYVD